MASAGIANLTSTRMDSASKHQVACRVSYEHMLSWVGYDNNVLLKEKMKFCMNKDDMAIGCSRPIRANEPKRTSARNKAYIPIVVTLAQMETQALHYLVALYHNSRTFAERDAFVHQIERGVDRWVGTQGRVDVAKKQIQEMPEFYFAGVSVGVAYAHPDSGDNIATAMLGGMKTMMNGAFDVQGGDVIQWYWDIERACFTSTGERIKERIKGPEGLSPTSSDDVGIFLMSHNNASIDDSAKDERRRKYFDRGNGNFPDEGITGKLRIALPKPFRYQDEDECVADKIRVFGKAVSSARKFEMMDVMICRQSM